MENKPENSNHEGTTATNLILYLIKAIAIIFGIGIALIIVFFMGCLALVSF